MVYMFMCTFSTVFLLKVWHENNNAECLGVNIQHSIYVHILFPYMYIAYTRDNLCQILETIFQSFGKGCRTTRRAKFLEEVRYLFFCTINYYFSSYPELLVFQSWLCDEGPTGPRGQVHHPHFRYPLSPRLILIRIENVRVRLL